MVEKRFVGRRVLITGASRGIGAAISERLAAEGADVAIVARTESPGGRLAGSLSETAQRIGRYGGKVIPIVADLADDKDRRRIVTEAVDGLDGPIEVLINNAAAAIFAPLAEIALRRRRLMFEVNFQAPLDLAQQVIPAMREAGEGWIVNVSSATADHAEGPPFVVGSSGSSIVAYGASKAALDRLSNGLAVELFSSGIRVNSIAPRAAVRSEGADELVGSSLSPDKFESMEHMVEAVVALGECPPEETGGALTSDELLARLGLPARRLDGTVEEVGD